MYTYGPLIYFALGAKYCDQRVCMSVVGMSVCLSAKYVCLYAGTSQQELIRRWDSEREPFTTTSHM